MKLRFFPLAAVALLAACSSAPSGQDYTVTVGVPETDNGKTAFIINYDTGDKIDSVMVADGKAVFTGKVESPVLARVIVDGNRAGSFILEGGDISVGENGEVSGTELNDRIFKDIDGLDRFDKQLEALPDDSTKQAKTEVIMNAYKAYADSIVKANSDNPIGYFFFLQRAYEMDLGQLDAAVAAYPAMKNYKRVQNLREALIQKDKTSPGHKFVDFTIKNDTLTQSLSDYVGKGRYTLVDFWASWCGPCIRETKVLKQIREDFKDQPLDILGVAVWDEPENTLRAIEQHQLPWPQIINAQTVPTELYGISGIPCIILFSPDGTILFRDKQGQELIDAVREALAAPAEGAPQAVAGGSGATVAATEVAAPSAGSL